MRILCISAIVVVVDQISKLLVKGFSIPALGVHHSGYAIGTSFPIVGDLIRFTYIENAGIAFGIDVGGKLFLTLFTLAASVAIFWYLLKSRDEPLVLRFALALVLGGAIGNLIDRMFYGVLYGEAPLFYGRVVDFIDVDFFNISLFGYELHRWPVFNVADASVSIGVVILILFHKRFSHVSPAAGTSESSQPPPAAREPADATSRTP
ncbi:MAG: signal peptidase II [Ignavibacteria bacterium]|nr:signal peptidase II [Ignavibacteria bacterium]